MPTADAAIDTLQGVSNCWAGFWNPDTCCSHVGFWSKDQRLEEGRGWQAWREKDLIMPAQGLRLCQLSSSLLQLALAGQSKSLWSGYEPSSLGASLRHTCDVILLSLLVLHNLFPPLPWERVMPRTRVRAMNREQCLVIIILRCLLRTRLQDIDTFFKIPHWKQKPSCKHALDTLCESNLFLNTKRKMIQKDLKLLIVVSLVPISPLYTHIHTHVVCFPERLETHNMHSHTHSLLSTVLCWLPISLRARAVMVFTRPSCVDSPSSPLPSLLSLVSFRPHPDLLTLF